MNRPSLLVVVVDALAYEYLTPEAFPRLWPVLAAAQRVRVKPVPFYRGADPLLEAVPAAELEMVTGYEYHPELAPYASAPRWLALADQLPHGRWGKLARLLAYRAFSGAKHFMPPQLIPWRMLRHLAFPQRSRPRHTVPELLEQQGVKVCWYTRDFPLEHAQRLGAKLFRLLHRSQWEEWVRQQLGGPAEMVLLASSTDLDGAGHSWGPGITRLLPALHRIDAQLAEWWEIFRTRHPQPHLLLIADHGMSPIRSTLDVETALRAEGIEQYLLHSALVQVWEADAGRRRRLAERLAGSGQVVEREEFPRFGIRAERRYGDMLYFAPEGVLLLPNHFQGKRAVRGMHGYAHSEHPASFPAAVWYGPQWPAGGSEREWEMHEIGDLWRGLYG